MIACPTMEADRFLARVAGRSPNAGTVARRRRRSPCLTGGERSLAAMSGLGAGTQTAQKVGTAAGAIVTGPLAPALIAAGPIGWAVLGAGALADVFSGVIGPDPRNVPDTQNIEAAQVALNNLWFQISGEQLPVNCTPGKCGSSKVNIFQASTYPNVPKGAQGDLSIDPNQSLAAAQGIIASAKAAMQKPASLQNPFFAPGGGNNIPGLLARMAAARASAVASGQVSPSPGVAGALPPALVASLGSLTSPAPVVWLAVGLAVLYFVTRG